MESVYPIISLVSGQLCTWTRLPETVSKRVKTMSKRERIVSKGNITMSKSNTIVSTTQQYKQK